MLHNTCLVISDVMDLGQRLNPTVSYFMTIHLSTEVGEWNPTPKIQYAKTVLSLPSDGGLAGIYRNNSR